MSSERQAGAGGEAGGGVLPLPPARVSPGRVQAEAEADLSVLGARGEYHRGGPGQAVSSSCNAIYSLLISRNKLIQLTAISPWPLKAVMHLEFIADKTARVRLKLKVDYQRII